MKENVYSKVKVNLDEEFIIKVLDMQVQACAPKEIELLTNQFNKHSPKKVIDVGCAHASFTNLMAEANPHIEFLGVDIDEKKLEHAKNSPHPNNVTFDLLDLTKDDFSIFQDVDAIYGRYTFQHLDCESISQKLFNAIKPGCTFYVIEAMVPFYNEWPHKTVFGEYWEKTEKMYDAFGSDKHLTFKLPHILNKQGYKDVDCNLVFYSNQTVNKEIHTEMMLEHNKIMHSIDPVLADEEYVKRFEKDIINLPEDQMCTYVNAVIQGTK
jgi:SAM-dependent methyltransferase